MKVKDLKEILNTVPDDYTVFAYLEDEDGELQKIEDCDIQVSTYPSDREVSIFVIDIEYETNDF